MPKAVVAAEVDPVVRKRYVELPAPTRGDDAADLMRLEKAVGPLERRLGAASRAAAAAAGDGFRGTAVLADGRLLDFEPGNTEWQRLCRGRRRRHHHAGRRAVGRRLGRATWPWSRG